MDGKDRRAYNFWRNGISGFTIAWTVSRRFWSSTYPGSLSVLLTFFRWREAIKDIHTIHEIWQHDPPPSSLGIPISKHSRIWQCPAKFIWDYNDYAFWLGSIETGGICDVGLETMDGFDTANGCAVI